MTRLEMRELQPGDRVRIIDSWDQQTSAQRQNPDGHMDHHLGTVMTVREVFENWVTFEEDAREFNGDGWDWFPDMLSGVVSYASDAYDELDLPPISDLFGGGFG